MLPKTSEMMHLLLKANQLGHLGVLATASKVRTKRWSPNLLKIIKSEVSHCMKSLQQRQRKSFETYRVSIGGAITSIVFVF